MDENSEKIAEFGSNVPFRFLVLTDNTSENIRCLDCESKSHYFDLERASGDVTEQIQQIKEAVMWILDNIEFPVGE